VLPTAWDELSQSSKDALRWASAMARLRADRSGIANPGTDVEADEFDLLVGIMLSHPADSEPRQLLAHIGASPADVLPPDYPAPSKDLDGYAAMVPSAPPPLSPGAESAVGLSVQLRGPEKYVELKALFGGLLNAPTPVGSAFRSLLSGAGLTGVVEDYEVYLRNGSGSYKDFLTSKHPYSSAPVEVPDYKADKSLTGDDLVDIRAEVDAFAYLLASRSLKPPLAVGLFGAWGSGKTFFMDAVQSRIAQLVRSKEAVETPQSALPFWKQIVQINFNAWHYVEGDLWASLVEHVFSQLRLTGDPEPESRVAKRQRHWLAAIEAKRSERIEVVAQLEEKRSEQAQAKEALKKAEKTKQNKVAELDELQRQAEEDVALKASRAAAEKALRDFADQVTERKAGEALDAIGEARTQLRRSTFVIGTYRWTRKRKAFAAVALLAVPLLVYALSRIPHIPGTAQIFAGISAALVFATAALRSFAGWTKAQLDELDKAETAIRRDIEAQKADLEKNVQSAKENVAKAGSEVGRLAGHDRALQGEIAELEARAKAVTSGQLLGEFIAERVGSSDYRKRLGTPALIKRDFDELSKLIDEQNAKLEKTHGAATAGDETVNRIILYIDDLDRCEPERVIEVLQAVHLLLAFPLFVVVVAVDSRWLAKSLADHYPALADPATQEPVVAVNGDGSARATPSDYLEKIFQVPFWIEPLGERARKALVRGLLQGNVATAATAGKPLPGEEPLKLSPDETSMVEELFGRSRAVRMQTAALTITPFELAFLDALAPLLGDTPRSIKRFVNIYQLLCALPVPQPPGSPLYEQAVALLLALTDGLPTLYGALRRELEGGPTALTVSGVVAKTALPAAEKSRWDEWAPKNTALADIALQTLAVPARRVERFTFHDRP
jgi:hypothetical protein